MDLEYFDGLLKIYYQNLILKLGFLNGITEYYKPLYNIAYVHFTILKYVFVRDNTFFEVNG